MGEEIKSPTMYDLFTLFEDHSSVQTD